MAKKFQREFRNRPLTSQEAKRDEEVRRQVQAEFPPATRAALGSSDSLSETLKQAIRDSGQSEYQIAKEAGVSQIVISRFLSGERDIRMATADKLAGALGLKLGAGKLELHAATNRGGTKVGEKERNLRVAEAYRKEHRWSDRTFNDGDYVALLDGKIVAVADNPDDAISALRTAEPDPRRGMVIDISPCEGDFIR